MAEKIKALKGKRKITALTCYDYVTAKILSEVGLDILLVGDSLGMVILGYENTHFVTLDDIIKHTSAVMRGASGILVVADMPIGTCDTALDAVKNCRRVVAETSVRAVKIEGNPDVVKAVSEAGISVMGHTGLKPQQVSSFKVQGKSSDCAKELLDEALALEKAGCFSVVLECIPSSLGQEITEKLKIPTIGIGAGKDCDGQILVLHDAVGLFDDFKPKFVRRFGNLKKEMLNSVFQFKNAVLDEKFPSEKESY